MALVSPDVPFDHPVHDRLERLSQQGLIPSYLHGFHPLTQDRLFELWKEANERSRDKAVTKTDLSAVRDALDQWGFFDSQSTWGHGSGEIRGGLWGTNSESQPIPEVSATLNPFLEQDEGRWKEGGVAGWVEPTLRARWGRWGAFDVSPRLHIQRSPEGNGGFVRSDLQRGALKLGYGALELEVGRFPVRWGYATSGSLILGGTQTSLTGLQLRTVSPRTLPWILEHLGRIQFSLVIARLDEDRTFPRSFLVAERMGIAPTDWLEFGLIQTLIMGGTGSPELSTLDTVLEVLGHRKGEITVNNFSNRNFLFDFRARIESLKNTTVYGEFYLEDCCVEWVQAMSNIVGVSTPPLFAQRDTTLHFEWVRTTEITYRNSTFLSGYQDRGHLLGHPIGPDAMGFYLYAKHRFRDDLWYRAEMAFERRGRNGLTQFRSDVRSILPTYESPEERLRLTLRPTWQYSPTLWFRGEIGYEWTRSYAFVTGNTRHHGLGRVEAGLNF